MIISRKYFKKHKNPAGLTWNVTKQIAKKEEGCAHTHTHSNQLDIVYP